MGNKAEIGDEKQNGIVKRIANTYEREFMKVQFIYTLLAVSVAYNCAFAMEASKEAPQQKAFHLLDLSEDDEQNTAHRSEVPAPKKSRIEAPPAPQIITQAPILPISSGVEPSQALIGEFMRALCLKRMDELALTHLQDWGRQGYHFNITTLSGHTPLMHVVQNGLIKSTEFLLANNVAVNMQSKRGETALMFAAEKNVNLVELLYRNGANIELVDKAGKNALMYAVRFSHMPIITYLCDRGMEVDLKDNDNNTALLLACFSLAPTSLEVIKYLMSKGANINTQNKQGMSSLKFAAYWGKTNLIMFLLGNGARLEDAGDFRPPLVHAISNGQTEAVRILCDHGAHVNYQSKDTYGRLTTPLISAVESGILEIVSLLLKKHPHLEMRNHTTRTALMVAVDPQNFIRNPQIVQLLCDHGADITAIDKNGLNARALALKSTTNHEIVNILDAEYRKRGIPIPGLVQPQALKPSAPSFAVPAPVQRPIAQVPQSTYTEQISFSSAQSEQQKISAFLRSLNKANNAQEAFELVQAWIKNGKSVNAKDASGYTALMYAAEAGYMDVARLLCINGAEIDAATNKGLTALMWASIKGHNALVQFFCEKGANINAKDATGQTALKYAAMNGHMAVLRFLWAKNAQDIPDNNGRNAFMGAAAYGKIQAVQFIYQQGGYIDVYDHQRTTALMLAAQFGHLDTVQFCCDKNAQIDAISNQRWTALALAAKNGHLDVVRLLCEKGADITLIACGGFVALEHARRAHKQEVVEFLEQKYREKGLQIPAPMDPEVAKITTTNASQVLSRLLAFAATQTDQGDTQLLEEIKKQTYKI